MMRMKRWQILVLATGLAFATSAAQAAAPDPGVLSRDGRVYRILAGAYGTLFSDGLEPADQQVLALEMRAGTESVRRLVPGTEDALAERVPLLLHDRFSDRLMIVWEKTDRETVHVELIERSAEGTWSSVQEVAAAHDEGLPIIRISTRDERTLRLPDGRSARLRRQILHLAWWQYDGQPQLFYTPILRVNGRFLGVLPTIELSALVTSPEPPSDAGLPGTGLPGAGPSQRLRTTVTLDRLANSLLSASFVDPATDHLMAVEIAVAPLEAAFFTDRIRDRLGQVFGGDSALSDGLRAEIIAVGLRAEIIAIGGSTGLDGPLLDFLAETGESFSSGFFALHPQATAEQWATALDNFLLDLLASIYATAQGPEGAFSIGLEPGTDADRLIDLSTVFDQPAPATGDGPTRVYVAPGGRAVAIGWYDADSEIVGWLEATGNPDQPWSEIHTLVLGEQLDLDRADALLRQRIR